MTINQARTLTIGQAVTHRLSGEEGTVIWNDQIIVRIAWPIGPIAYPVWRMHSIHIMAEAKLSQADLIELRKIIDEVHA